jgi:hypothetical protein
MIDRKNWIVFVVLGMFSTNIYSQNIDGICSEVSVFGNSLDKNEIEYLKYQPFLRLKNRYSSFDQVRNSTPEELMISQMSVLDNDWLSYNFSEKIRWTAQQFERIKTQNKENNYIELVRKVSYTFKNVKYSIMRVSIFDEKRKNPVTVSLMAKFKENRWVLVQNKSGSPLEFFLMNLGLDYLDALFENEKTSNIKFNEFIKSSWIGNKFELAKAYSKLGNSMLDNDTSLRAIYERNNPTVINKDSQKYNSNFSFEKKKIKTDYLIPLSNQRYCNYFINELSEFKEKGINKLIEYLKITNASSEGEKPKITPIHKFEYSKKETKLIFIKYLIKTNNSNEEYLTNVFESVDGTFKQYKELDDSDKLIKDIITVSKQEIITEFSNGEDNTEYPEINKLKALIKDANGILDIKKLAQVVKENKSTLSKYLD